MIERHVSFNVLPGREADFEVFFDRDYASAMARHPGFRSVTLLRQNDVQNIYQMVIRFDSAETATAWRASAEHKALSPQLNTFHTGSEVAVYQVLSSHDLRWPITL